MEPISGLIGEVLGKGFLGGDKYAHDVGVGENPFTTRSRGPIEKGARAAKPLQEGVMPYAPEPKTLIPYQPKGTMPRQSYAKKPYVPRADRNKADLYPRVTANEQMVKEFDHMIQTEADPKMVAEFDRTIKTGSADYPKFKKDMTAPLPETKNFADYKRKYSGPQKGAGKVLSKAGAGKAGAGFFANLGKAYGGLPKWGKRGIIAGGVAATMGATALVTNAMGKRSNAQQYRGY